MRRFALPIALVCSTGAALAGGGVLVQPGDLLGSTGLIGGTLVQIDPDTGTAVPLHPHGSFGPVVEIAYGPNRVLYGTTGAGTANLITIDPDTGVETLVGQHAPGAILGMTMMDDTLLGTYQGGGGGTEGQTTSLVEIDPGTATVTPIGPMDIQVHGLAWDPDTQTLYGLTDDSLFTIDPGMAGTTFVGSTGAFGFRALDRAPDGRLFGGTAMANRGVPGAMDLALIDPTTGAASLVGNTGYTLSGLAFVPDAPLPPVAVPTVSTVGLLLLALVLGGAALVRLRFTSAS